MNLGPCSVWTLLCHIPGVMACYSQLAISRHCSTQTLLLNFVPRQEKFPLCVLKKGTATHATPTGPSGHSAQARQRPESQGCPPTPAHPWGSTSLSQGPWADPAFIKLGTDLRGSPVVKNSPCNALDMVRFLVQEDSTCHGVNEAQAP